MSLTKATYSMIQGAPFNVLDYGADPTGTNDSAAAFQATVDAAGYGGSIYVPEGQYKFNSTVNIPPASGLESAINIFGNGGITEIVPGATIDSLFYVTGSNVYFTELSFGNLGSKATTALKIVDDSGNAAFSSLIQDCSFVGFTNGIYAKGQNFGIQNNFFQNNGYHIHFANDGRNTYIDNNYMLGGYRGIYLAKDTIQAEGVRITNNTILVTGGNGFGIAMDAGLEIFIGFNIIDQTGDNSSAVSMNGVVSGGTYSRIKIQSNWLNAGKNAYGIFASGNASFIDVIDNTINDNGKTIAAGISYSTVNTSKIAFNNFLLISGNTETSFASCSNIDTFDNTARDGSPYFSSLTGTYQFGQLYVGTGNNTNNAAFLSYKDTGAAGEFRTSTTGANNTLLFVNGNGTAGSVSTNGTNTSFNTSSDYRLKENVVAMTGALEKIAKLNPVTFTWKVDGSEGQGFIAHELQAVAPDCVTGKKDAVDEKGNPVYQGIDTSFLVATLVKAVQELKSELDVLKGAK